MNAVVQAGVMLGAALGLTLNAAEPLSTWHRRPVPASVAGENLAGVAYGAGRWVVVGEDGVILSSPDGTEWTTETSPIAGTGFSDITFGQGLFVAVGRVRDALVVSTDGRNWTKAPLALSGAQEVIHDGTRFIIAASGGFLALSTNGTTWAASKAVPMKYVDMGGIAFGNGTYAVAGYMRTGKPTDLHTSPNLKDWTFQTSPVNENLFNVGYGLGLFVAVGQKGALMTSPDGATWTARSSAHNGFIWDVATNGKHLVAAAQWGRLLISSNATEWRIHQTGLDWHLTDIAYGGGTFVAVGWDGSIVQSEREGTTAGGPVWIYDGRVVGGKYRFSFEAEAGRGYDIEESTDGRTWSWNQSVEAGASVVHITDLDLSGPARLYRVGTR